MNFISLFSGVGGFDIGLEMAGMTCVGQVEKDKDCQKVLEKHYPNVKRMGDIHGVRGDEFGRVDVICGSPPCQPASVAGKRKGTADDRWLWGETFRVVRNVKPSWCLFENVRGLLTLEQGMVFDTLLFELEDIGYDCQTFCIPACAINAPHRRDRIFILGRRRILSNSNGNGQLATEESRIVEEPLREEQTGEKDTCDTTRTNNISTPKCPMADTESLRLGGGSSSGEAELKRVVSGEQGRGEVGVKLKDAVISAEKQNTDYTDWEIKQTLNPDWVEWLMGFPIGHTNLISQGLYQKDTIQKED